MATNFDNEKSILEFMNSISTKECLILSDYEGSENYIKTTNVLSTLLKDDIFERWLDNSKSQFPPDYINEIDNLMMEIMRVDDHSRNGKNNATLKKESAMHNELSSIIGMFPNVKNVICNAVTDLPTNEDHNYKNYYLSFKRTINKHINKISNYKKNHPNKKLIFLVMDETSGVYFEQIEGQFGRLHFVFFDNRFVKEFINSEIDYLIHFCPFNHYETVGYHITLPRLIIFDVKCLKDSKMMQYIDYDENKMISSEK